VLVWSRSGRRLVWVFAGLLIGVVYLVPLAVIALASLAHEWNGILPNGLTTEHYARALSGDSAGQIWASVGTGLLSSALAIVSGTWAALALRQFTPFARRLTEVMFFIPSAVPSVSVGLGLLVAFSRKPLLLNGTTAIVIIAHFVLVSAFTFANVTAGLSRLAPEFEQVAQSLGARPAYCLRRVTLPLMLPQLAAAFSLSFALSMGELGATIMVYPPGWVTLPVGIFALTDRGEVFDGSALTIILVLVTLAALLLVSVLTMPPSRRSN
jgi:2-aminoethylphosphonate transport system permease protein